jgi:hypothetical protein
MRIIDFDKTPAIDDDGKEEGSLSVHPQPLAISDGNIRMEVTGSTARTRMCSVNLYDVEGRLISTVFKGELEQGAGLEIDLMGKGGESIVPGVYFLSAELGDEICTTKIVLLR